MTTGTGRVLSGALVVALLAAGCTGPDTVSGPRATATATTDPDSTVAGDPTQAPVFDEDDAVLNVAIPEPATLDPMRLQDPGSVLVARQLFEGLTRWDQTQERVQPAAAQRWTVSDGGRTFAFRLREGMSFHDGTPVTSQTFKFAFERIAAKGNASDLAYTLELVDGFAAVNQSGTSQRLAGISAPDPLTLVFRLSEPFYDFPAVLTHPGLVPLPPAAVRDVDEFLASPTGNGPFQIAEPWSPGQPVILRSFPGFIQTPELDGIRLLPYPDAAASWLPFVRGDLDVAEVPAGQLEEAQERFGEEGFQPFLAGYYYGLNIASPAMKDRRLRIALNRAIDRSAIAQTIYKGSMEPPRGIVPIGMPGFQENFCLPLCRYSPDAARSLLEDVPEKKRKVTLEYTQGEPHGEVARFVKRDLEAVGMTVRVKSYPFPEYLKRLQKNDQEMYRYGWIAEYPVADVFLSALFASDSPDNHSGFRSSKVDSLLAEAHAERSEGRREQLYIQAEKAILKDAPLIPIGSFVTHWATQSDVQGIQFDVTGGFDAAEVALAEE
ncbi:MAG TPA: peptide ABC transporter substrate-binding protein [Actinomycetota bacterium]|nr:peptide ABC transporter substrate-binding protein [Actinomycetota bacterium]